jgi:anti-sigma factor RsiW
MECIEPGAIRDEELLAYLGGERVRPAVLQHLANCQYCSAQLAAYQRMDHRLKQNLYRWNCPPSQQLGEYQLGLLSPQEAAEVQNHLASCPLCMAELTALATFLANDPMLVESPMPQVRVAVRPAGNNHHSVQEVKRAIDQAREQVQAGVRRIIATLVPSQPRLAFQRDVASEKLAWPRRYVAEDMNISLQVESELGRKDGVQLIGFVTRKDAALDAFQGMAVRLIASPQMVYMQKIDELGNFVFSAIAPATYTLELDMPEGTVVIDQLTVTALD